MMQLVAALVVVVMMLAFVVVFMMSRRSLDGLQGHTLKHRKGASSDAQPQQIH